MLKKHYLVCALGLILLFTGCQRNDQSSPSPTGTSEAPAAQTTAPEETAPATESPAAPESPAATESPTTTPDGEVKNRVSLGEIKLGDSQEAVKNILGSDFKSSTEEDVAGLIGEDLIAWTYEKGIAVYFGKDTGTVLRVVALSADFKTELGAKVGDIASEVLGKYKTKYKEVTSPQGGKVLEGWFDTGNDIIVIFDFNKEDGSNVNTSIDAQAPVQAITIGYLRHYD